MSPTLSNQKEGDTMKKSYAISASGIDNYIWDVRHKCHTTIGVDRGDAACYPLVYYINTGRASGEFLRKLFAVSPTRIARICMGGGSHDEIISRIKKAVKYRDSI